MIRPGLLAAVLLCSCAAVGTDATVDQSALESASSFAISLTSDSPNVNLGERVAIDVTVKRAEGFAGELDLGVSGLPSGVTAAPVHLAAGDTTASLVLTAALTAYVTPRDARLPITVSATSGREAATAAATFKVMPYLTITIPRNVSALYSAPGGPLRAEWGDAFGPNTQPLHTQPGNGIVISIFNDDTMQHIIHGPNVAFPHGDFNAPIQPNAWEMKNGAVRTRTMNVGDTATAYIHGEPHSDNASFKIVIAATP